MYSFLINFTVFRGHRGPLADPVLICDMSGSMSKEANQDHQNESPSLRQESQNLQQ